MGVPSSAEEKAALNSSSAEPAHRAQDPERSAGDTHSGCVNLRTITRGRNLVSYWILGFCNNFTYWVLITAAVDILARTGAPEELKRVTAGAGPYTAPYGNLSEPGGSEGDDHSVRLQKCQSTSTGALLVAETLPAASITLTALVFLRLPVNVRVLLVVSLCLASYLTLAFSAFVWLDFAGVLLASVSRGLSDITFLAYAGQYERDVLSTWSSGTGVATFVGPLLYSGLTSTGLNPRRVLLAMASVPLLMGVSFWVILVHPSAGSEPARRLQLKRLQAAQDRAPETAALWPRLQQRLRIMRSALVFILPLTIYYLEMYFIGSGLLELIYFPGVWLTPSQQYSWYITIQCFGVMVSRSGHRLFHTDRLWLPCLAQGSIVVLLLFEACLRFLPSVWIMFTILLLMGLLEGTEFKSTMFTIYSEVPEEDREECLAMMPIAFFIPAVVSGFLAIPVHTALCRLM